MTDGTKDRQLQRFVHHVLLKVDENHSCKTEINFGDWTKAGMHEGVDYSEPLWDDPDEYIQLANGFYVFVTLEQGNMSEVRAKGFIGGVATASAAQQLTKRTGPQIEALIRSLKIASTDAELELARQSHLPWIYNELLDEKDKDFVEVPPAIGDLCSGVGPFGRSLNFAAAHLFIKSPFARRIRNALELTVHADNAVTNNTTVALSICVSALEALLCNDCRDSRGRREKKTPQLKLRIPAVLQADQKLSDDFACAFDNLYDVRSRYFHGDYTPSEVELSRNVPFVRRLIAAVLRGALEWAVHKTNTPEQVNETEWRKELEAATRNLNYHVAGVTKDLAEHLRAFTNVFGKDRLKAELPDTAERDNDERQ
jgi:hypothetical protein